MSNTTTVCHVYANVDGFTIHYDQEMDKFAALQLLNNKKGAEQLVRLRYPGAKKIEHATVTF